MNISILGAGAMGSLFGGLLAESGQSVTLLDINDTHLEAIRRQGLRLDTDDGDRCIGGLSACRPEQVTGQPDLLLVFTKAQHTDSALRSIAGHIGEHTLVLTLQNGLGNAEALCRHVAPQRVMIGMTTWPADMAGPAHVRSHGQGVVRLLSLDGVERQGSTQVAAVLEAAGLHCAEDPQVWTSIWEKVAFNAALNSLCAVTGCTVGQLDAAPQGPALARAIVLEVLSVAQSVGGGHGCAALPGQRGLCHCPPSGAQAVDAARRAGRPAHGNRRDQWRGPGQGAPGRHRRAAHRNPAGAAAPDRGAGGHRRRSCIAT